jgi:hypothetical protein
MFPNIQVCVHLAAGAFPIMIIAATVAMSYSWRSFEKRNVRCRLSCGL